jgi:SAM-dependent methyltransferase
MMTSERILEYFFNKKVLVIGVLGDYHRYKEGKYSDWDYIKIRSLSKDCLGLDIDERLVLEARRDGFNDIIYGDAETCDLKDKFNIIYAGDVIEHLNNPGLFLSNMKRHLKNNGKIIISTGNPYSFNMICRSIFGATKGGIYFDHTFSFHEENLKLLFERHSLISEKVFYYTLPDNRKFLNSVMNIFLRTASLFYKKFNQDYAIVSRIKKERDKN